jgi:DNA (cytosine-5)-methyltransferase 1
MTRRPLLLDLFCKAGGCSVGFYRAGFDVIGCDIEPQPNYPFPFVEGDALELLVCLIRGGKFRTEPTSKSCCLEDFAAFAASPPCQKYSRVNRRQHMQGRDYPDLINPVRELLEASGKPYVIENVEGAPLISPAMFCGTSFNLPNRRHRIFESSILILGPACRHELFREKKYPTCYQTKGQARKKSSVVQVYGNTQGSKLWPAAMGIDWKMTRRELSQAIPPAYTEYIGRQLRATL